MEWVSRKLLEKSRISLSYKIKIANGEVWEGKHLWENSRGYSNLPKKGSIFGSRLLS